MRFFFFFVILLVNTLSFGQSSNNIAVGSWRTHLPTNSVKTLALNQTKLYCASDQSAFTFDQADGYMAPLSKIDGLTETQITVTRFNEHTNVGVIGYVSGNIDFILNGTIKNFDVIFRSTISGSKKINSITLYDDLAFVACDYGVTLIDLNKFEVKESWLNLRTNALPNKVYECSLNNNKDSIFLATEYGIMSGLYNRPGINLMDFSNWKVYSSLTTGEVRSLATLNGSMYCGITGAGVYIFNGSTWANIGLSIDSDDVCWNLINTNNQLVLCATSNVYLIQSPNSYQLLSNINSYENAMDAIYDHSGNLWLADANKGLIKYANAQYSFFSINGPASTSTFALYYYNNTILSNSGGYSNLVQPIYNGQGFYQFEDQKQWTSYNRYNSSYPNISDNVVTAYNPYDDSVYIGYFGVGMMSWDKGNTFILHNTSNSVLKTNYINGLDVDSKGTLWMAAWVCFSCDANSPNLYTKDKKGQWSGYKLSSAHDNSKYLLQIKIDAKGNKWLRYGRSGVLHGLILYNETTGRERHFIEEPVSSGISQEAAINDIEIDAKGSIWLATSGGVYGMYDPAQAFTGSFTQPIFNGYPLLFDKTVTCIKTDGGNRKWVGTTDGLWLFNDDFSKSLLYFDITNSPLYSNSIIALEIHDITGELFIATDRGVISYRPDASQENEDFSNANIFPNPVRPGFGGVVTISGLNDNATVKITDMQGKLYYETRSTGGTATWNLVNYAGIKAETGMYLVFATAEDGIQRYVGKIAIVQ